MANCHNLFQHFDERITLPPATRARLRTSRDNLREKIRTRFRDEGYSVKFYGQGSFPMTTIISPVDGDYDLDDGTYIDHDTPPEEAISTLHSWIVEVAEKHTSKKPTDKNACVRVYFADGHHIDLALYYLKQPHPLLAHQRDGWIESDPKEFMDWFNARSAATPQLKRIVRYLKAWADNLRGDMPSGLVLTILAADNLFAHDRDDVACTETLMRIRAALETNFVCFRPTTPYKDLFVDYSQSQKEYFLERLRSFADSATQAIETPNQKDACPKWRRHLGARFPCELAEDAIDEAKAFKTPALIRGDARSA